jgi:hypothetical protein
MISLTHVEATGARASAGPEETDGATSKLTTLFHLSSFIFSTFAFATVSRLALIGLLSSAVFASPSGEWAGLSSMFVFLPIVLLAPAIGRLLGGRLAHQNMLPAYLGQAAVLAVLSVSLPVCPSSRWLTGLMCALVVLNFETFWIAGTALVPSLNERRKWQPVNALRFLTNLSATMLSLVCFSNLPLTLPQLLRLSALLLIVSAIPLIIALRRKSTETKDLSDFPGKSVSDEENSKPTAGSISLPKKLWLSKPFTSRAISGSLVWFAVALSCALPLTTIFLLAIDLNSPLSAALIEYCKQLSWGCLGGVAISLFPFVRRSRLSLLAIPTGFVTAGCFICFVEPTGQSVNIALLLLGAAAAFSYIQLDTRMQRLFRRQNLGSLLGWRWACCSIFFLFAAILLKPHLDTIAATMLLRLLSTLTIICTTLLLSTALLLKFLLEKRTNLESMSRSIQQVK